MRKTPLILLAGAVAVLILGDVIEIRFHAEKIAGLPQAAASVVKDKSLYEKLRAASVHVKRRAEQTLLKDKRQRFEIALSYVEADSARLRRLAEEGKADPEKLSAQARLLEHSLNRVREESETLSVEDLISLKDKSGAALTIAQETLASVAELEATYEKVKTRLAEVRQVIEAQVGKFAEEEPSSGGVAGTSREQTPSPEASIPLKF